MEKLTNQKLNEMKCDFRKQAVSKFETKKDIILTLCDGKKIRFAK